MGTIKLVLDKILHDRYDFCCVCFKAIGEAEKCYNIRDEIMFCQRNSQNLFEILSSVVGYKILNNLTDFVMVCKTCTKTAIQTYKFIMECREKSLQLRLAIKSIYDYFENTEKLNMSNTLFACLDAEHVIRSYSIIRDINIPPFETFNILQTLPKIEENAINEVEQENELDLLKENNKECNDAVEVIDINKLTLLKCKICYNTYSRASNLKKHHDTVHAPKVYKCSSCPKSFGSEMLLKTHKNHRHSAPVCCTECGKVYSNVYCLQVHEKRHKMSYICQHCGKVYKTKHIFQNHIDKCHRGVLKNTVNFTCNDCGKTYSQKSAIRVHIQLEHGNGKFLECHWCKKKFSSDSRLKQHIITHTKEKRYSCEICHGRFSTKMSLLYHTRIHTGERPYQCQHCDTSFLSASRRMTHTKQYHMPGIQECDVCHKKFKLRTYLLRHRHRHFDPNSKLYNSTKL